MNPKVRRAVIIAALCVFVITVFLIFLNTAGVPITNIRYVFSQKPELPNRDLGEKKITADRESVVMTRGYDALEDDLKEVYETVGEYINKTGSEMFWINCSHEDFIRVHRAYLTDHPEVFWLTTDGAGYRYGEYDGGVSIEYRFSFDGDYLDEMKEELSKRVEKIMSDAPGEASDYELELYFNEYLTKTVSYDEEKSSPMRGNPYGALIYGRVVCAGYSTAFQQLCNRAGIECSSVYGYITNTDGEGNNAEKNDLHQWNCVKIEGDWYYTDVTWNDNSNGTSAHAYFNITADEIKRTRSFNPFYEDDPEWNDTYFNYFAPECDSKEYNYYQKTGAEITDLEDDTEILAVIMDAAKQKKPTVDLRVSDSLDYESTVESVAKIYAFRWIEGVNYYNGNDPSVIPPTQLFYYKKTHCIVLNLDYR